MKTKRILLGISGGIAAYKCAELVRLLVKQQMEVRVVMTEAAMKFVAPMTLQALSGSEVHTELFNPEQERAMGHIALARWADVLLIAPATADIVAKLTHGLADDLLTTLYLAAECPVFIAPAMNQAMWRKAITQQNIQRLKEQGVQLIGPESGEQACGDVGFGRMAEPVDIVERLLGQAHSNCLQGRKVLLTAGPTRESIDPVRFISNRSSGKMGYAIAEAAHHAGAEVTLVSGPVNLGASAGIKLIKVETAAQMHQAVMAQLIQCDIFIATAAVADYTVQESSAVKIKKHDELLTLTLTKTPDILAEVANQKVPPFTVGFAAETEDLERYALDKLQRKKLSMIAANWVGREQGGFEDDQNALRVFWNDGQETFNMMPKQRLAEHLIALIAQQFNKTTS